MSGYNSWTIGVALCFLVGVWLWLRFQPIIVSVIGFDWEHEGILFKEAARKASRAIGRRVLVKPNNGGVGMLVPSDFPLRQLRVPTKRVTLVGSSSEDVAEISEALRLVVANWEASRSRRLLF